MLALQADSTFGAALDVHVDAWMLGMPGIGHILGCDFVWPWNLHLVLPGWAELGKRHISADIASQTAENPASIHPLDLRRRSEMGRLPSPSPPHHTAMVGHELLVTGLQFFCDDSAALGSWSDARRVSAWPGAFRALLTTSPTPSICCVLYSWTGSWIPTYTRCFEGGPRSKGGDFALLHDFADPHESAVPCHHSSQWRPPCSPGFRLSFRTRQTSDAIHAITPSPLRPVDL